MSRNKIKANTALFAALAAKVRDRSVPPAVRYVATADEFDRGWLTDGEITGEFRFDSINRILLVRYGILSCAVLVNFEAPRELPVGLAVAQMNGGLFTLLGSEADVIAEDSDGLEILDRVFLPADNNYTGHPWELLSPYFQPLMIIAIEPSGPFDCLSGLAQIALIMSASVSRLRTLDHTDLSLENCQTLALDNKSEVPYALMAHALVAVRWEHCFLELYRCVERLFSLPTIVGLKSDLDIKYAAISVSSILEKAIGWRKPEEAGLATLLEACNTNCSQFHREFCTLDNTVAAEYSPKAVALHIYKLRNSIVHYRPATELPTLSNAAWRCVINFLVEAIMLLYARFRSELYSTGPSSVAAPII